MARKKRSRTSDVRIPDELRRRLVCALCGQFIGVTCDDPVVSAPSLGNGQYHLKCANLVWAELKNM